MSAKDGGGGVHRLIEMVVEEVSLVDRAANKRRFLVVKRSIDMKTNKNAGAADDAGNPAAPAPSPGAAAAGDREDQAGSSRADVGEDTPLAVAAQALEQLTEAVELLGQSDQDEAPDLIELAAGLRAAAEAIAGTPPEVRAAQAGDSDGGSGAADRSGEVQAALASVRTILSRVAGLVENAGTRREGLAPRDLGNEGDAASKGAPRSQASQHAGDVGNALISIGQKLDALGAALKDQQQRLAKIESYSGLPQSMPVGEQPPHRGGDEEEGAVGWPLDLNRASDRESVDKTVSFFD